MLQADEVAVRTCPAGGWRSIVWLNFSSPFTLPHNKPSPAPPATPTPPVPVKGQHRGGSTLPLTHLLPPRRTPTNPSTPSHGSRFNNQPLASRAQSKRGASEGPGPLRTLHCLQKASPHCCRSACNTVRGVAHYRPSPLPLCLLYAAERRIQLPGRLKKEECGYINLKKKKEKGWIRSC